MRYIGTLPEQSQATTFADYLLSLDIKARLDAEDDGWVVWVFDEDHVERAREEFEAFQDSPDDERYRQSAKEAETRRRKERKEQERLRKKQVDVRQQWERPLLSRIPATAVLIGASILVALLTTDFDKGFMELCTEVEPILTHLFITPVVERNGKASWMPSMGLAAVRSGEVHRLITPIFIHFSILHLLFNMLWLRTLGGTVEMNRGSWRLLLMVLTIAVTSNLAQYVWSGPFFGGMSGVVFGLFGYMWMKSRYDPQSGFFIPPQLVFLMIGWMIFCYIGPLNIANAAHTVGLLAGVLMGLWPVLKRHLAGP